MTAVPKPTRNKKAKKPKKSSITDYKKLCDELWRVCIHVRDKNRCQYTLLTTGQNTLGSDAHHIFTRDAFGTRWTVDNGILLKAMHNVSDAHVRPEKFKRTLIKKGWFTQEEFDHLYQESEKIVHYKQPDYEIIKNNLIAQLNLLLKADPGYVPLVRERMERWLKKWPITQEEKASLFA